MEYYKVEITVGKDGTVTEKVLSSGPNCAAVTEELEKAIGVVQSQEFTPEYLLIQNQETNNNNQLISKDYEIAIAFALLLSGFTSMPMGS